MTTGTFSPSERKLLLNAPHWVYAALTAAERGSISTRRSEAKALAKFLDGYKTRSPLVKDILAGQDEADDKLKGSLKDAEKALGEVAVLLDRKASAEEANAVRDLLVQAGGAIAEASREAVFGDRESKKETKTLARIEKALKATEDDQRRREAAAAAEAERRQKAEARAEAESKRKEAAEAEAKRKAEEAEAKKKAKEEAEAKKIAAEAKKKVKEAQAKRKAEEAAAKKKAEEEAEAKRMAEAARKKVREAQAKRRAEAEAKKKAEEEAEAMKLAAEAKEKVKSAQAERREEEELAKKAALTKKKKAKKAKKAAQAAPAAGEDVRIYVVKKGDTLSHIALEMYGNAGLWKKIYKANKDIIKKPSLIRPGWKLRIPDLG
jgi:phage tail protein X